MTRGPTDWMDRQGTTTLTLVCVSISVECRGRTLVGYRQLVELMKATTFVRVQCYPHVRCNLTGLQPWISSNIIDVDTSEVPPSLNAFQIFERSGLRIGVIGLVEEEWIGTVANWPANFVHKDMQQV
ncbi:unnamed protein product, partial [Mycena citricolor]